MLKHAFGRMGDAVVLGSLVPPPVWEKALDDAARQAPDWLLQERFEVTPLEAGGTRLYPGIGAYLVNHRFAGYYSRAAAEPFITHEAYHVATLVESA